jgi:hypothetical protein
MPEPAAAAASGAAAAAAAAIAGPAELQPQQLVADLSAVTAAVLSCIGAA